MEERDRDKRTTMFTVRDAENAMITFMIFAMFCLLVVLLHEMLLKSQNFSDALYTIARNMSAIMSAATMLTIFEEAIDIMFQRIRDTLKRERELKAQISAEAMEVGKAEGRAEGKAEGKAEAYREVAEWNNRRLAAEARGEKFTEPPPGAPLNR